MAIKGEKMSNHIQVILDHINNFIDTPELKDFLIKQKDKSNQIIILNNSFLFRESKIKTKKNQKYLAFVPDKIPVEKDNCFIVIGPTLNKNYKSMSINSEKISIKISLEESISQELQELGKIIFILMGEIDENARFSVDIDHLYIKTISYCPKESTNIRINNNEIILKNLEKESENWKNIEDKLKSDLRFIESDISDLKNRIGNAFDKLKRESYINLKIPESFKKDKEYFLELIIKSIEKQYNIYQESINNLNSTEIDRKYCLNEILRISYNFVDDVNTLIHLIVSICDLKPIILWETYCLHYDLDESIRLLPWSKQNTKPSLFAYINTIKKSRNKSFHRLIPFSKAFEILLPENSIKGAKLRIFSEFGSKSDTNKLNYEDRELIDVLTEFKRTSEEIVSDEFWEKNCKVIEATIKLLKGVAITIRGLRE